MRRGRLCVSARTHTHPTQTSDKIGTRRKWPGVRVDLFLEADARLSGVTRETRSRRKRTTTPTCLDTPHWLRTLARGTPHPATPHVPTRARGVDREADSVMPKRSQHQCAVVSRRRSQRECLGQRAIRRPSGVPLNKLGSSAPHHRPDQVVAHVINACVPAKQAASLVLALRPMTGAQRVAQHPHNNECVLKRSHPRRFDAEPSPRDRIILPEPPCPNSATAATTWQSPPRRGHWGKQMGRRRGGGLLLGAWGVGDGFREGGGV